MPSDRPFAEKNIFELADIYKANATDVATLEILVAELAHRKARKAQELRKIISDALVKLREQAVSPASHAAPKVAASPPVMKPTSPDHPLSILAAWTALEALSPQTYRRPEDLAADRQCVADLTRGSVPWNPRERSRPNRQLYYQVILGAVPMDRATDELIKTFGQDEERSRREREKAAIAAILVDRDGIVLEKDAIAVSSFAWALPLALQLKLQSLGAWTKLERTIQEKVENIVRRFDSEGRPIPLDLATIYKAHEWIVNECQLPAHFVEPTSFALRIYHYYKSRNPPEISLLNSFYLTDLAKAATLVEAKQCGAGLRRYLGIEAHSNPKTIFPPSQSIDPFVTPSHMPPVRWPSAGGYPLTLLQQASVNAARMELGCAPGIIAVNGPPGTGKTTLLRDLVAACIFDRAVAMAGFDDPNDAFSTTGQRMAIGESAFFHFYRLHETLRGHEIIVASSNNKAVENVSMELPVKKACGRDFQYFRSISDIVANPKRFGVEDDISSSENNTETWGLVAAALGNAKNRSTFQQSFWWHENGFRIYLKAAKGDPVVIEVKDPDTGRVIERKTPQVVMDEKPSASPAAAKAAWIKARNHFLTLKGDIEAGLRLLEKDRQQCLRLPDEESKLLTFEAERRSAATIAANLSDDHRRRVAEEKSREAALQRRADFRSQHRVDKPGFFSRLFKTNAWRSWAAEDEKLAAALKAAQRDLEAAEQARNETEARLSVATAQLQLLDDKLANFTGNLQRLREDVSRIKLRLGDRVLDPAFFAKTHETIQIAAPWLPDSLHRKREDLFAASLEVHKAFVDVTAQKVLHNISSLMSAFTAGALQEAEKKALLGDLWSTLFLIIPVLSTTFASANRMLGDLPPESFGWLLIDEAGQALPQAAVGGIMRAKRTIVVGDPMQIPPVVSLPERLNAEICSFFRVTRPLWAAPAASGQTLADRASPLRSAFRSDQGLRHVGVPLLVHRRCQEPMFGISNAIAYDGQMVQAAGAKRPGEVGRALGISRWFDVDGEAQSKWCPEEGEVTLRKLIELARHGIQGPDLFIISPFRIVAREMRSRINDERNLLRAFDTSSRWVEERVGTIHTFQGREAETVILLLGAPNANQSGARQWAAGEPNILNVAVSRAKQNFYVVGSGRVSRQRRRIYRGRHSRSAMCYRLLGHRDQSPSQSADPAAFRGGLEEWIESGRKR
jgi:hypothetical protein